jgi:hypothetical protein
MIILLLVIALAVLSQLYGFDSRETIRSREEELASYGMRWPDTPSGQLCTFPIPRSFSERCERSVQPS